MAHAEAHLDRPGHEDAHAEGQQHPIRLYITVWVWLFILSAGSYMVDLLHFQGLLRWGLVGTLMMLKAGLIVAVFMHVAWERLALTYVILVPPLVLLVFVAIMALEGSYTEWMRLVFM
ncbi:cytochrome C oxidase subunit IV family protein [Pelagibacterium xiamenense]|uniref:cytochrome C oxidase subunit IV family protein n=1 Tax=Pelagibacterium xiamenense TaxID=2901140 RepID=UPI001E394BB0|nr:cytochrome C oxidase subunit IV family protein [Pelagibacterium xiamenense]MCD7058399.1 cytochrome C oxidase subunit IV family protein [Pelagibacterium xiamenense]